MSNGSLAGALDDCIARMKAGVSVDECVGLYPEMEAELRPLLAAMQRLREVAPAPFPVNALTLGRSRLLMGIRTAGAAGVPGRGRWSWRRALLASGLIAAAVILGLFAGRHALQAPDTAEAATILTVLQGDVRVQTAKGTIDGRSGVQLKAGDKVITQAGSRAVLTFLDGSTVTLDADTVVTIGSVLDEQGSLRVRLTQERGQTWTHVPPELGSRQIEIDTPTARVEAGEGAFSTAVEPSSGRTEVGANTGSLEVSSGGQRTAVSQGSRTSVDTSGAVGPSTPSTPPARELVVRISGPGYGYVTDPAGATVGVLAAAYSVSQVPGATVTRDGSVLTIRIPDPAAGSYVLGVHGVGAGSVQVGAGVVGGKQVATGIEIAVGEDWKLSLSLLADSAQLGSPVLAEASAAKPANVAIPPRVIAAATATASKADTATPQPGKTPVPVATPQPSATPTKGPATPVPVRTAVIVGTPVRINDQSIDTAP